MSTIMSIPARFAFVVVGDSEYKPNAEGKIKVEDPTHIEALKQMGGEVINERVLAPASAEKSVEKAPTTEAKPAPSPTVETPSESASEEKIYPNDNWKRAEVMAWLADHKIAVDPNMTKVAALKIVADLKAKG